MSASPNNPHEFTEKISVNLPHSLLEKIDAAAAAERRNRTSWLVYYLERIVDQLQVADAPGNQPAPAKAVKYPRIKGK